MLTSVVFDGGGEVKGAFKTAGWVWMIQEPHPRGGFGQSVVCWRPSFNLTTQLQANAMLVTPLCTDCRVQPSEEQHTAVKDEVASHAA